MGMLWAVLSTHLDMADLRRLAVTILSTLPQPRPWHVAGQDQGSASQLHPASWKLEEASGQVHVRNLLLHLLLRLSKHYASNQNQSVCDELHRVLTGGLMLHILSRRVHPSSMAAVLQLLDLHLVARPKHAKRFVESGGLDQLKDVMAPYCACPHAYLLMLHAVLGTSLLSIPWSLDAESLRLYMKPLERREVVFVEGFEVIGSMLQRASRMCAHRQEPAIMWTSTSHIRTSLIRTSTCSQPRAQGSVEEGEMLGFVSELLTCLKLLLTSNLSFRKCCQNDALLVHNLLSIVLPSPWDTADMPPGQVDMDDLLSEQAGRANQLSPRANELSPPLLPMHTRGVLDDMQESEEEDHLDAEPLHVLDDMQESDQEDHLDPEPSAHTACLEETSPEEEISPEEAEAIARLEYAWMEEMAEGEEEMAEGHAAAPDKGVGRARAASLEPRAVSGKRVRRGVLSCDVVSRLVSCDLVWSCLTARLVLSLPLALMFAACFFAAECRELNVGSFFCAFCLQKQADGEGQGAEASSKRRVTMGGVVGATGSVLKAGVVGAGSIALMPVVGAGRGVGALGRGALYVTRLGSSTPAKGFNTSNFQLLNFADDYMKPSHLSVADCAVQSQAGVRESSFAELSLNSPGAPERVGSAEDNTAGPRGPRAPYSALLQVEWCLANQALELLCLAVLECTKMQGRAHNLLRTTLDDCVPLYVGDSGLAAYQTRMLLSIVRFLVTETTRDLVLNNTKMAINMSKLCDYAVEKLYNGWMIAGSDKLLSYCVHCCQMVADHAVYINLYQVATASTWKIALYLLRVVKGQALNEALEYMSQQSSIVFNEVGMDNAICAQVFKALCDLLLNDGPESSHPTNGGVEAGAGKVAGQLLSVNSPHTRQAIMSFIVYKPSMTAKLFRKGEKEKAIDLMKNGFEKLCGSESISSFNPLRTGWKAGAHLTDFRAWALEPSTKTLILTRLAQALEGGGKEWEQKIGRQVAEDACALRLRAPRDLQAAKRRLASQTLRLAAMQKRDVSFPFHSYRVCCSVCVCYT